MFGMGPPEMVMVAIVAILLFGEKLPEVARKLGGSYRELKRGMNDVQNQFRMAELEASRPKPAAETRSEDEDDFDGAPISRAPKFTPPAD